MFDYYLIVQKYFIRPTVFEEYDNYSHNIHNDL